MSARVLPSPSSKKVIHSSVPSSCRWMRWGSPSNRTPASARRYLGCPDVLDLEVEHRARAPLRLVLPMQVEAHAAGIEEDEVAEGVEVREAQRLAIEARRPGDVTDEQRNLPDAGEGRRSDAHARSGQRHGRPVPGTPMEHPSRRDRDVPADELATENVRCILARRAA